MRTSRSRFWSDGAYGPVRGNRPGTVISSLEADNFYRDDKTGQEPEVQSLNPIQQCLEGVTIAHLPHPTPENQREEVNPGKTVLAFRAGGTCVLLVSIQGLQGAKAGMSDRLGLSWWL